MNEDTHDGVAVYLETGQKRVFACAFDWPGWCRSGKTEDAALDALVAAAPRYAAVAHEAGLTFPDTQREDCHVVERVQGSAGYTDYGVPGTVTTRDREPWGTAEATRQIALVRAAWRVFDRVVAVTPPELRKGPRGGGRDRDQVVDHVLAAETAYARKLGVRGRQPAGEDAAAIAALHAAIAAALEATAGQTSVTGTGWPPRYAARRIAWHILDHAWEMEDRRTP